MSSRKNYDLKHTKLTKFLKGILLALIRKDRIEFQISGGVSGYYTDTFPEAK